MPPEPFAVYTVPDDAPAKAEAMGTKPKFWFSRDEEMWLFKATRRGQGEHWAEVIAAGLAELLGLPHAHYEFASWRDKAGVLNSGVVTRSLVAGGFDLVHGNELLAERDPSYPPEGARYVRTQEHTIEAVRGVIGAHGVGLPIGWEPPLGIESPVDVFGGYLLLDAWIGNTDRHHENWAIVVNLARDRRYLAPTFDHASSLGAHEQDDQRRRRLESHDPAFRVGVTSSGPTRAQRSTCGWGTDPCPWSMPSEFGPSRPIASPGLNALILLRKLRSRSLLIGFHHRRCPDLRGPLLKRYLTPIGGVS